MSIEKRLNYKFKYELKTSKSPLLFISPERVNITGQTRMFFLIVLSCYCFYILPPWLDKQYLYMVTEGYSTWEIKCCFQ